MHGQKNIKLVQDKCSLLFCSES